MPLLSAHAHRWSAAQFVEGTSLRTARSCVEAAMGQDCDDTKVPACRSSSFNFSSTYLSIGRSHGGWGRILRHAGDVTKELLFWWDWLSSSSLILTQACFIFYDRIWPPERFNQRWGLESLDSDSSRTRVPILLDSDSDSSPSHLDSDSDSRHADSDSTRTRTVGTRPDSANCKQYYSSNPLESSVSEALLIIYSKSCRFRNFASKVLTLL